jgi:hypothetical protein
MCSITALHVVKKYTSRRFTDMTEETVVELNGAEIRVRVNNAGAVTTKILGPEQGHHTIKAPDGDSLTVNVTEDTAYVRFSEGSIHIPHDDGTIPRVVGHKMLPGWLMGQLRLLGFEMCEEYGWSDDDEAPFVSITEKFE